MSNWSGGQYMYISHFFHETCRNMYVEDANPKLRPWLMEVVDSAVASLAGGTSLTCILCCGQQ